MNPLSATLSPSFPLFWLLTSQRERGTKCGSNYVFLALDSKIMFGSKINDSCFRAHWLHEWKSMKIKSKSMRVIITQQVYEGRKLVDFYIESTSLFYRRRILCHQVNPLLPLSFPRFRSLFLQERKGKRESLSFLFFQALVRVSPVREKRDRDVGGFLIHPRLSWPSHLVSLHADPIFQKSSPISYSPWYLLKFYWSGRKKSFFSKGDRQDGENVGSILELLGSIREGGRKVKGERKLEHATAKFVNCMWLIRLLFP